MGFEIVSESNNETQKTYSLDYVVWSADKEADRLEVQYRNSDHHLKILSAKSVFKGPIKAQERQKGTVKVVNSTRETGTLLLDIKRLHHKTWDSKTIQVQVAPM